VKAIILSAGQGRRLLPLTEDCPKCLLPVGDRAVLHWQLDALAQAGCREIVVVVGFGADKVEAAIAERPDAGRIRTLYNPFYALSNNLATCWVARHEMDGDFLIVNGDVVFQDGVLERVFGAPSHPVTVTINRKAEYDDDDMKVRVESGRVTRIGKDLPPEEIDAEAIGLHAFRGEGPRLFREALEAAVRKPGGLERWYLTVVDELSREGTVSTLSVEGLGWAEIDTPDDLADVQALATGWLRSLSAARA